MKKREWYLQYEPFRNQQKYDVHLTKLIISGKITQSGYAKFKRFKTISGPTEIGDLSLENLKQELVIDEVFLQRRQKDRGVECQETAERRFDFFCCTIIIIMWLGVMWERYGLRSTGGENSFCFLTKYDIVKSRKFVSI